MAPKATQSAFIAQALEADTRFNALVRVVEDLGVAYRVLGGAPDARRLQWRLGADSSQRPVVGDWLLIAEASDDAGAAPMLRVPEHNALTRIQREGQRLRTLARNVDQLVCVVDGSRALPEVLVAQARAMAERAGIPCAVWATKTEELAQSVAAADLRLAAPGSAERLAQLHQRVPAGETLALVGLSGVGKSTLTNDLVGGNARETGEAGRQGLGRHTSVTRQLLLTAWDACVIDTPGVRHLAHDAELAKGREPRGLDTARGRKKAKSTR